MLNIPQNAQQQEQTDQRDQLGQLSGFAPEYRQGLAHLPRLSTSATYPVLTLVQLNCWLNLSLFVTSSANRSWVGVQLQDTAGQIIRIIWSEVLDHRFVKVGHDSWRTGSNDRQAQGHIFHQLGGQDPVGETARR